MNRRTVIKEAEASGMTVGPRTWRHGYWDREDQERGRFAKGNQKFSLVLLNLRH